MNETRPARPSVPRSRTVWTFGVLVAVTGLMLTAPATIGLTYTPPYSHVQKVAFDWLSTTSGCATQKNTAPTFTPLTGNASWRGKVLVGSCGSQFRKALTDNVAEAEGATELLIPVRAPLGAATSTTFNVTWNITAAGNIGLLTTSPCFDPLPANTSGTYECLAVAIASLIGDAWLIDLTNGTMTLATINPISSGVAYELLNYTTCNPNCTSFAFPFSSGRPFSGPQSDTFTIDAKTNHAHRYAIVTYIGGWAGAELIGYTGHATAFVDMANGGNGAKLVSIVET